LKKEKQKLLACVASVSVGFEGIFDILPARKMGREAKMNYGGGGGEGRFPSFLPLPLPLLAPFSRCNFLLPNPTETLATQAKKLQDRIFAKKFY